MHRFSEGMNGTFESRHACKGQYGVVPTVFGPRQQQLFSLWRSGMRTGSMFAPDINHAAVITPNAGT